MYYPYLRGRQFELIALREFALQRGKNNNIFPIIEPVKKTYNSMKLAIPKLVKGNVKFALILNPQVGDKINSKKIIEALEDELADDTIWTPTFILNTNYKAVKSLIEKFGFEDVMLICSDMSDSSNINFERLILLPQIKYVVSKENRTLKRMLRGKRKLQIRLDDNFNVRTPNSEYLKIGEEKFSEEHTYYLEDGYNGFSDYTILNSKFRKGGAPPLAVVIHLTYKKTNEEIWVKHFTSTTNDDISNVQGKFAEAAKKAVTFLNKKKLYNNAANELRLYYQDKKYPGLGMVKKISIKNHLELMNEIISTEK